MIVTVPGVYDGIPDEVYHADPVVGGSLSSTGARTILKSPALFKWRQEHRVESDAFDVGRAVHAKVLGVGMGVRLLAYDSFRTKAAQEDRDSARADGLVPMLVKDYGPVEAMSEAVLAHPIARALLEAPGASEQSMFAQDPESGVWLRARIDRLPDAQHGSTTTAIDLKTSMSADPNEFRSSAATYGYDIQSEFYQHALRLTRGDTVTSFAFIVVEKSPPHLVSVIELDAEFAAIGRARMRRAIDTYKACADADEWPGYEAVVHYVDAPRWLAYDEGLVL